MSAEEEIREMVDEAKRPGVFSIVNVLKERAYPEAKLTVTLNEEAAYLAAVLKDDLDALDKSKSTSPEITKKREELATRQEELMESLRNFSFTFHLRGISEGKREELYREALKKYPIERTKDLDIVSGKMVSEEKPSPERDSLYTDLLWREHIVKIEDPSGNVQEEITYSDVREMRTSMPIAAITKINDAIEKLRVATAVFMLEVDEDFLAKSSPGPITDS